MAEKAKRLDVYELKDQLLKVAEKEARKKPDISKEELKKKLSDYITKTEIAGQHLTPGMVKIVEHVTGVVAEVGVKMVEIFLREKHEFEKDKAAKAEKKAEKPAAAPKKKAAAKKPAKKK